MCKTTDRALTKRFAVAIVEARISAPECSGHLHQPTHQVAAELARAGERIALDMRERDRHHCREATSLHECIEHLRERRIGDGSLRGIALIAREGKIVLLAHVLRGRLERCKTIASGN